MAFTAGRRRWIFLLVAIGTLLILLHLLNVPSEDFQNVLGKVHFPGRPKTDSGSGSSYKPSNTATDGSTSQKGVEGVDDVKTFKLEWEPRDNHPISKLMTEADRRWRTYDENRSETFRDTVANYRRKYGRHPPPGFVKWYRYARKRNVHNIDDFDQIMDDLRPFWAIPPKTIRALAAHMWEPQDGLSGIHIRKGKVVKNNKPGWRPETLITLIEKFVEDLPDMDIAVNVLDQPRVVISWEDLQEYLSKEFKTRQTIPDALNEFTPNMQGFLDWDIPPEEDDSPREEAGWFHIPGKPYMDTVRTACPPDSHARNGTATQKSEAAWKDTSSGIVTNFNLSSDLCTMGPELGDKHGLLYAASSLVATRRLVPVFGECKVNVNNDILFPANMYWKQDDRYDYDDSQDVEWEKKQDVMLWRGVTSGGTQIPENWRQMHRQRLVQMTNSTFMKEKEASILSEKPQQPGDYDILPAFKPSAYLENHSDVGFVKPMGCIPGDCGFYNDFMTWMPETPFGDQFNYKYLIDLDGHSFSGRWRAFLESRALGIKATIFREWHDSRLFAWRHFVPLDNRYEEIYSILGYFTGIGNREDRAPGQPFIPEHGAEAKRLALQGREWANKVLRREDIEVSLAMYLRVLLADISQGLHVPSSSRVRSNHRR